MQKQNISTAYRQELKGRIVTCAAEKFKHHGIKAVKMDDIAASLAISKRTLYEIFGTKEELVIAVAQWHDELIDQHFKALHVEEMNVIEILLEFYRLSIRETGETNVAFYYDISKYPKLVEFFNARKEKRNNHAREFFRRGVAQGYFRKDVDYNILMTLFRAMDEYVGTHDFLTDFPMEEVHRSVTFVIIRGLCTSKGVELIDSFLK